MSNIGRPKVQVPKEFPEYYARWKNGELQAVSCMALMDLSKSTFYRMVQEYEWEQECKRQYELKEKEKQSNKPKITKKQLEILKTKMKQAEGGN